MSHQYAAQRLVEDADRHDREASRLREQEDYLLIEAKKCADGAAFAADQAKELRAAAEVLHPAARPV